MLSAGFVPGTILTVVLPRCVSTELTSYAWIVIVRFDPAGIVIVPDATPLSTGILKTKGVVMSGAVTSTTTIAAVVPARSAWIVMAASLSGSRAGPQRLTVRARASTARARVIDLSRALWG